MYPGVQCLHDVVTFCLHLLGLLSSVDFIVVQAPSTWYTDGLGQLKAPTVLTAHHLRKREPLSQKLGIINHCDLEDGIFWRQYAI